MLLYTILKTNTIGTLDAHDVFTGQKSTVYQNGQTTKSAKVHWHVLDFLAEDCVQI